MNRPEIVEMDESVCVGGVTIVPATIAHIPELTALWNTLLKKAYLYPSLTKSFKAGILSAVITAGPVDTGAGGGIYPYFALK